MRHTQYTQCVRLHTVHTMCEAHTVHTVHTMYEAHTVSQLRREGEDGWHVWLQEAS